MRPGLSNSLSSRRAASRWTAAVAASLVVHAAATAALWRIVREESLTLFTPQAGLASIMLTASLAAEAEPTPPEVEFAPIDQAAMANFENTADNNSPSPTALARVDAAEPDTAPLLFEPVEPILIAVDDAERPIVMGGQAERRTASRAAPPLGESTASPAPARRRLNPAPELSAAVSVPSPASQAREGVESDDPPQVVVNRPPVYPPDALAAGKTGRVLVRAEVAADGRVLEVRIHRSSGVASLDRAALAAVRSWRFSSAADPAARPRPVNVPIDFVIRR